MTGDSNSHGVGALITIHRPSDRLASSLSYSALQTYQRPPLPRGAEGEESARWLGDWERISGIACAHSRIVGASSPTKRYKTVHLGASTAWCTAMELAYRRWRPECLRGFRRPEMILKGAIQGTFGALGWRLPRGRLLDLGGAKAQCASPCLCP